MQDDRHEGKGESGVNIDNRPGGDRGHTVGHLLPVELYEIIFSHLSANENVHRAQLVCKQWLRMARSPSLWMLYLSRDMLSCHRAPPADVSPNDWYQRVFNAPRVSVFVRVRSEYRIQEDLGYNRKCGALLGLLPRIVRAPGGSIATQSDEEKAYWAWLGEQLRQRNVTFDDHNRVARLSAGDFDETTATEWRQRVASCGGRPGRCEKLELAHPFCGPIGYLGRVSRRGDSTTTEEGIEVWGRDYVVIDILAMKRCEGWVFPVYFSQPAHAAMWTGFWCVERCLALDKSFVYASQSLVVLFRCYFDWRSAEGVQQPEWAVDAKPDVYVVQARWEGRLCWRVKAGDVVRFSGDVVDPLEHEAALFVIER